MAKMDQIRKFEAARSERFPWLDGATTRAPKTMPVKEASDPSAEAVFPEFDTPTPEAWRREAKERIQARRQQAA